MYRLYQLFIALPVGLLHTFLCSLILAALSLCGFSTFAATYVGRWWAWFLLKLLLIPVEIHGLEHVKKGQSYVFVANHQGAFDIFGIYGYLSHEFKWMMKKSLGDIPFVGMACRRAGFIFVDKSSHHAIAQTMKDAQQALRGGASLCVFPEGARTFTGHMGKFRRGAFQLADALQLPVVPITIDGSFEILPRMRGFSFIERHTLKLTVHAPIPPKEQGPENVLQTLEESYAVIMKDLPAKYQGFVENKDQ